MGEEIDMMRRGTVFTSEDYMMASSCITQGTP